MCNYRYEYFSECQHQEFYLFSRCKIEEQYQRQLSNRLQSERTDANRLSSPQHLAMTNGSLASNSPRLSSDYDLARPSNYKTAQQIQVAPHPLLSAKKENTRLFKAGQLSPVMSVSTNPATALKTFELGVTNQELSKFCGVASKASAYGDVATTLPVAPNRGKENCPEKSKDSASSFKVDSLGSPTKAFRSLLPKPTTPRKSLPNDTASNRSGSTRKVKTIEPVLHTAERAVARERRKSISAGTTPTSLADHLAATHIETDASEPDTPLTPTRIPTLRFKARRNTLKETEKLASLTQEEAVSSKRHLPAGAVSVATAHTVDAGVDAGEPGLAKQTTTGTQPVKRRTCGPANKDDKIGANLRMHQFTTAADRSEANCHNSDSTSELSDLTADDRKQTVGESILQKEQSCVPTTRRASGESRVLVRRSSDIASDVLSRRTPSCLSISSTTGSPSTPHTVRSELRATAVPFSPAASPSLTGTVSTIKTAGRWSRPYIPNDWMHSDAASTVSGSEKRKMKRRKSAYNRYSNIQDPYWAWAPARSNLPDHLNTAWTSRPFWEQRTWAQPFGNPMVGALRGGGAMDGHSNASSPHNRPNGLVPYYVTQFEAMSGGQYARSPANQASATIGRQPAGRWPGRNQEPFSPRCNMINVEMASEWIGGWCRKCEPDEHMAATRGAHPSQS